MRAIRVGSRYYIPLDEYYIFPYINKGAETTLSGDSLKNVQMVVAVAQSLMKQGTVGIGKSML